ncbi:hypothetical protein QBC40DRAFT_206486 [Triangularia verruculosa]|uniref:NACHT domain-containing protein n=1 Tax=Triangularia verruculosa TaxID=2587418 RepID=A0AAN7AU84_9PEZI|nr:hypothetical protein QBC40DRAFT_206486 [Triangularia verruculosa]
MLTGPPTMDPATGIGVVSGCLSFITFAFRIIKGGVEIYQQGHLTENATVEDVVTRMNIFYDRLKQDHLKAQADCKSSEEQDVCALAEECQGICAALLRLLKSMKPSDPRGLKAKWKALSASWNSVFHAKERAELELRLNNCQRSLTTVFTWSSRVTAKEVAISVERNGTTLKELQDSIQELRDELALRERQPDWVGKPVQNLIKLTVRTQQDTINRLTHDRILQALQYDRMRDRSNNLNNCVNDIQNWLKEEVGGSFDWLFEPESVEIDVSCSDEELAMMTKARERLHKWLSSDGGILHILGKLGCGKSTLMQLLYNEPSTQRELERWAGDRKLIKVNYFFSVIVGGHQQTLVGLFRTLLHDMIKDSPALASEVMPCHWRKALGYRWINDGVGAIEINDHDAEMALQKLMCDEKYSNYCFCVFIDALDEYQDSERSDQTDLVNLLHKWAPTTRPNVKLCIASRPEPVFLGKFSTDTTFLLHELTRYDMQRFVSCRLSHIDQELRIKLTKEIPEKAQGIFLWTHLVVREMREDWEVTHDLDVRILERFPAGLRPLLDRAVTSIPERYRRQAYLTFTMLSLMMEYGIELSILQYSFVDDFCRNPSFAYTMAVSDWQEIGTGSKDLQLLIQTRTKRAARALPVRCKGLVQVVPSLEEAPPPRFGDMPFDCVVFVHRSVVDYFQEPPVRERLLSAIGKTTPAEAVSETLLAEFSVNNSEFRSLRRSREPSLRRFWFRELINLRTKHGMDTAPYKFLNQLQAVFESTQLRLLTQLAADKYLITLYLGYRAVAVIRNVGADIPRMANVRLVSPLLEFAARLHSDPLYLQHILKMIPAIMENPLMARTFIWVVIDIVRKGGPLSTPTSEFLTRICKSIWEHIDTEAWFHPATTLHRSLFSGAFRGSLEILDKATVWQQYLLSEVATMHNLGFQDWSATKSVQFGQLVEAFLLAGADPNCWLSMIPAESLPVKDEAKQKPDLSSTQKEVIKPIYRMKEYKLQLRIGHDRQKVIQGEQRCSCLIPLPFELGPATQWPLREWIDMCSIPNKGTLLALIDKRPFQDDLDRFFSSLVFPGSWVERQTEEIAPELLSTRQVEGQLPTGKAGELLVAFLMGSLITGLFCSFILL